MTRNTIRDGQTRKAAIAPTEGLNEGLTFEYRPLLPIEFQKIEDAVAKQNRNDKSHEAVRIIADVLAQKVVAWSEETADGKPVPISSKAWLAMPFPLIKATYDIISGYRPSDALENDGDEADETVRVEQLLEGMSGRDAVEADQKN